MESATDHRRPKGSCRVHTAGQAHSQPHKRPTLLRTQHNMPDCSQPSSPFYTQGCHVHNGTTLLHGKTSQQEQPQVEELQNICETHRNMILHCCQYMQIACSWGPSEGFDMQGCKALTSIHPQGLQSDGTRTASYQWLREPGPARTSTSIRTPDSAPINAQSLAKTDYGNNVPGAACQLQIHSCLACDWEFCQAGKYR